MLIADGRTESYLCSMTADAVENGVTNWDGIVFCVKYEIRAFANRWVLSHHWICKDSCLQFR